MSAVNETNKLLGAAASVFYKSWPKKYDAQKAANTTPYNAAGGTGAVGGTGASGAVGGGSMDITQADNTQIASGVAGGLTDNQYDKAGNRYNTNKDNTQDNAANYYEAQRNTPGESLNKRQNDNIPEGEGYDRLNRRSHEQTLQLSRDADAYNSMVTGTYRTGQDSGGSGMTGPISIGSETLNKPKLETEEMREMDKSRRLDYERKLMAQQFQDAVNRKDFEAWKKLYEYYYQTELTDYQAKNAFAQFTGQLMANLIRDKDYQTFMQWSKGQWSLKFANTIWQISQYDPGLSTYLGPALLGMDPMTIDQTVGIRLISAYIKTNQNATADQIMSFINQIYYEIGKNAADQAIEAYNNMGKKKKHWWSK